MLNLLSHLSVSLPIQLHMQQSQVQNEHEIHSSFFMDQKCSPLGQTFGFSYINVCLLAQAPKSNGCEVTLRYRHFW